MREGSVDRREQERRVNARLATKERVLGSYAYENEAFRWNDMNNTFGKEQGNVDSKNTVDDRRGWRTGTRIGWGMENKIENKSNQTLGHQQHTSITDLVFARKRNAQNKGMEGD